MLTNPGELWVDGLRQVQHVHGRRGKEAPVKGGEWDQIEMVAALPPRVGFEPSAEGFGARLRSHHREQSLPAAVAQPRLDELAVCHVATEDPVGRLGPRDRGLPLGLTMRVVLVHQADSKRGVGYHVVTRHESIPAWIAQRVKRAAARAPRVPKMATWLDGGPPLLLDVECVGQRGRLAKREQSCMANISKFMILACWCFGAASACSTAGESTAVTRQALTFCNNDSDCDFGPGFLDGEHCTLDHTCRTIAQDPSCGLWTGTYPNCNFYDPCRTMYCAQGTECSGSDPYLCTLAGPGYNVCAPYAYADPCVLECTDDDDCDSAYACESTPNGNVCG